MKTAPLGVYSSGAANIGTFALGWRLIATPPPLNDRFANADVIWGRYGHQYGDNANATREAGEPAHAGRAGGRSEWYRWTAPTSGPAMFHAGGFDCLIAVYTGTAVNALTAVAADSGTWAGGSCTARFTATAGGLTLRAESPVPPITQTIGAHLGVASGTTYWIQVTGVDEQVAHYTLRWQLLPQSNDEFAEPLVLPPTGGVAVDTTDASASDDSGVWSVGYSHDLSASWHDGPQPEPAPYGFSLDTERYSDGPLELTADAWDVQGNHATSAPRTIILENRPPWVRIFRNPPERLTLNTSAHLEWEASEPLSQSVCALDGAPYTDCSGPAGSQNASRELAGLTDGVHVFRVVTTDMAGKTAVDAEGYQWIVDTKGLGVLLSDDSTAPTATGPVPDIYGGHPIGNTTAAVRMRWTSSDGSGTGVQRHDVQASTDGGAWTAMPSYGSNTAQIYQLASGHTFRFRVCPWSALRPDGEVSVMTDLVALPTCRPTGPRPPRGPGSRGVDDRAGASAGATVRCSSRSGGRGRRYAAQPRYDPGCVRRTAAPGSHRRYGMTTQDQGRAEFDSSVPHPARIYDYLLGGKDNYPADRAAAEATLAVGPEGRAIARANRRFLVRAVRFLAEQGIRQFIDIGTGIPTSPNVHEVAQAVAPDARVVYVDNDPLVLVHARALLKGHGLGETSFIQADLRDPEAILSDPDLVALIDFAQPLAVLLVATLHHIPDADDPAGIVTRLLAPAVSGSYLVVSQLASDLKPERAAGVAAAAKRSGVTLLPRRRDQVLRFFAGAGLDLVEPGLVQPPLWRPDPGRDPSEEEENLDLVWFYAGVARKP